MSLRIFLIRPIKIRLSECRCSNKDANRCAAKVDKKFSRFHTCKCSTNSSTSRRFSGEIRSEPLWAPLYWNSSLCSNSRRICSRDSALTPTLSPAPRLTRTYPPPSQHRRCLDRHCVPARLSLERPWKPPRNIPVAIHHCGATCASVQQLHGATPRSGAPHGCRSQLVGFSIQRTQVTQATESAAPSRKLDERKVA